MKQLFDSILILGPTASGKTKLAVQLAAHLNSIVISADSRQVYKELNIGSGKDLSEYVFANKKIPYRLIDCCTLEKEFTLVDFIKATQALKIEIESNNILPVICGGSGLYIESMLKPFDLFDAAVDKTYRAYLEALTYQELQELINQLPVKIEVNALNRYQLIRKIEHSQYKAKPLIIKPYRPIVFGLNLNSELRWKRIQDRLNSRFQQGMVAEVESLLQLGISPERLKRLGLEYKYIVGYLLHEFGFEEMKNQLYIDIRKFAKRQMTYFRKMERDGLHINWLDASYETEQMLETCLKVIV